MEVHDAVATGRALVAERFPDARAAWLAGSVVSGDATPTSDLDITVLLPGPPAPFRESLEYDGWPVELFVHTRQTVARWIAKDIERRRPTLARLISTGVVLLDDDGVGAALAEGCTSLLAAGPGPVSDADRDSMRYALTDILDDLADCTEPVLSAAVAFAAWEQAVRLLLAIDGRWWGTGKWLVRELRRTERRTPFGCTRGWAPPWSSTPCCSRSWPRRFSTPPAGRCGWVTASRGDPAARRGVP
jgi:predicted nucleotidyltransferase